MTCMLREIQPLLFEQNYVKQKYVIGNTLFTSLPRKYVQEAYTKIITKLRELNNPTEG
jgi:hypothetical protein